MGLVQRQVMMEFGKVFLAVLIPVACVMLAVVLGEQFLERGYSLSFAAAVLPYLWPLPVRFAVIAACVFGACTVFGRMSAENELLAIRSTGISPLTLVWPVLLLMVPFSVACVWLEDLALSWGHENIQRVAVQSARDLVYQSLRTKRNYRSSQFEIVVKDIRGTQLIHPTITFLSGDAVRGTVVGADHGVFESGSPEPKLWLTVRSGYIRTPGGLQVEFTDEWKQEVPLERKPGDAFDQRRIRVQRQEILDLRRRLDAARARTQGRADHELQAIERELVKSEWWLERLEARFQKKWSGSFCCLFGTMLAIPVAILLRTHGINSFFLCYLPIVVVYEPLSMLCYELAKAGRISEWAIWTGNAVMGLLSSRLLWRIHRH